MDLIKTIQEELLKSAELTGRWEKKLREIEKGTYPAKDFLTELKEMVKEVIQNVKSDNSSKKISIQESLGKELENG